MSAPLIKQIVDLHRRQLFGVIEIRGVKRMQALYGESRRDLEEKLAALKRQGRGQTFQANHLRQVLVQVADAAGAFQGRLTDHLRRTGRVAAVLAPRHLVDMVTRVEQHYRGQTSVVQAAQAAVTSGVYPRIAPTLLHRYQSSARTWGPGTIAHIQEGLARSLVQGESVDEAVGRVTGAAGLYDGERWRAERIVRTETSYSYGVAKQVSMTSLGQQVPQMKKRLVATHDNRTGQDSVDLDGQTVAVDKPFTWAVKDSKGHLTGKVVHYMQPPNRPNDREVVIPWMDGWSPGALGEGGPVEPTTQGLPDSRVAEEAPPAVERGTGPLRAPKRGMMFRVEIRSMKGAKNDFDWTYQGDSRTMENAEKLASQMRGMGMEARVVPLGES